MKLMLWASIPLMVETTPFVNAIQVITFSCLYLRKKQNKLKQKKNNNNKWELPQINN